MKNKRTSRSVRRDADDLLPEYDLDYSKARPNRFAARFSNESVAVVLDADISRVFTTPKSVNTVLRALIATMPSIEKRKPSVRRLNGSRRAG
jgi:hypothetical protein